MQETLTEAPPGLSTHKNTQLSVLLSPLREELPNEIINQLNAVSINPRLLNLRKGVLQSKRDQLRKQLRATSAKVARYELALCTYRNCLSDYAEYLRGERESLAVILKSWIKVDDCATYLYESIVSGHHLRFQQSICEVMNSISDRYPSYQIKKSSNMGLAVDNALCAVEVSFEDIEMLQRELEHTKARSLVEKKLEKDLQLRIIELTNAFENLRRSRIPALGT